MASIKLKFPTGVNKFLTKSGVFFSPDSNNLCTVDTTLYNLSEFINTGFTIYNPNVAYSTDDGTTQTLTTAMVTGANQVFHLSTGGTTPTLTTPTAAAIIAAQPNFQVGDSYFLEIQNANSGTATVAGGSGVTITGTATIATTKFRRFMVTQSTATTVTLQDLGVLA